MTRQEETWLGEYAVQSGEELTSLIKRRNHGEPLQYIIGEWEFYGYNFKVGKGVLIPRPETEFLVDLAKNHKPKLVYDLCAGTGCVGISSAKEIGCEVVAVEKSKEAIIYLQRNAQLNNVQIKIKHDDVLNPIQKYGQADCILINPPYLTKTEMKNLQKEVTHEPKTALYGGEDGLDFYKSIFKIWNSKLKPGGLFAVEVGDGQAGKVAELMKAEGLNPKIMKDYSNIERIVYSVKI